MAAVTIGINDVMEMAPNSGVKSVIVKTPATADDNDTIALVLETYGISELLFVRGWVFSTVDSVVVAEAPTTSVTTGTLTVTLGAVGGANKVRVLEIVGIN